MQVKIEFKYRTIRIVRKKNYSQDSAVNVEEGYRKRL